VEEAELLLDVAAEWMMRRRRPCSMWLRRHRSLLG
jgi:hypothetical protein